jgi:hypothetical protein
VVDRVPLREIPEIPVSIDVVVRGARAHLRLSDALERELVRRRTDQLDATLSDLQTALINEGGDIDESLLESRLIEVRV